MKINLNGEEKIIDIGNENALLSDILENIGYSPNTVVVELNDLIINSKKWGEVRVKNGDNLEIVSIVGGG